MLLLARSEIEAQTQDPCFSASSTPERTIAACTAVLEGGTLTPHDAAYAHNDRGLAYHATHQDDLAIADYTAALQIDPNYANAYQNRGAATQCPTPFVESWAAGAGLKQLERASVPSKIRVKAAAH